MKKMNVLEAAEHFKVSKEAIHNRIRRGSLQSVVEDGTKYVLVDETQPIVQKTRQSNVVVDERYYKLLEEQNAQLQQRVQSLETETRSLRDQKELMLVNERKMIEQVYKEKDEQLKNILSTFQAQLLLSVSSSQQEHLEAEIEEVEETKDVVQNIISLKKYLKEQNISDKKALKIRKRFKKKIEKDQRIITVGKKIYLDLQKYDYSDLL